MQITTFVMMFFAANLVWASGNGRPPESVSFDEFYTVKEQVMVSKEEVASLDPLEVAQKIWIESLEGLEELTTPVYSLLSFVLHNEPYGDVAEPYNRQKHFGGWVDDRRDSDCYNTRAKVLIRDSQVPVQFRSGRGCTVLSGKWIDPYGGREYTSADDIQIDHVVPLKNAYMSGAHNWSRKRRCLYGNFLGNNFHLLPVYGKENNVKGDKTPQGYMPSQSAYRCEYLAEWLKIKLIWSLGLTPPEKEAILGLVQNEHCDLKNMIYEAQDLERQRRFMEENKDLCQ